MPEFIDYILNNIIITRAYVIVAALIISVPISFLQSKITPVGLPPIWLLLNKLFLNVFLKLNVESRAMKDLLFRGAFVLCLMIAFATLIILLLKPYQNTFVDTVFLALSLSSLGPYFLFRSQDKKALAAVSLRAIGKQDENALNRIYIISAINGLSYFTLLPILAYIIGGLPMLIMASLLGWLCYMLGKNALLPPYNLVITLIETLLLAIPNFLASVFITMATLIVPKARFKAALGATKSLNPIAVGSYALNVALGGKEKSIHGETIDREWLGPKGATAKVTQDKVRISFYLIFISLLLLLFSLFLLF